MKSLHVQGLESNLGPTTSLLGIDPNTLKMTGFDLENFTVVLIFWRVGVGGRNYIRRILIETRNVCKTLIQILFKKKFIYLNTSEGDPGNFLINQLKQDPKRTKFVKYNKEIKVIPI